MENQKRHTYLTCAILFTSYLIAIATKELSTVLSLVGATGSTTILPGLFYFRFREKTDPFGTPMDTLKISSLVLAGLGVLIMSTSVTAQIISIWNHGPSIPH